MKGDLSKFKILKKLEPLFKLGNKLQKCGFIKFLNGLEGKETLETRLWKSYKNISSNLFKILLKYMTIECKFKKSLPGKKFWIRGGDFEGWLVEAARNN